MIYFNELYLKLLFSFLSCVLVLFIVYFNQHDFIFILSIPTLKQKFNIEYFIFTTPNELFYFTLITIFSFSLLFLMPYIIWSFIDFLKPALRSREYRAIKRAILTIIFCFFIFNLISFYWISPLFWNFFSSFSFENKSTIYKFFFELRAITYYKFLISVLVGCNCIFALTSSLLVILLYVKKWKILNSKKYLILIILLISTVLTPPLLEIQISLFVCLYMCLEIFFYFLFFIKIYKGNQLKVINNDETKIR